MTSLGGLTDVFTIDPGGHAVSRPATRHWMPAFRQRLMTFFHTEGSPANQ
jgi:hypothetical protein